MAIFLLCIAAQLALVHVHVYTYIHVHVLYQVSVPFCIPVFLYMCNEMCSNLYLQVLFIRGNEILKQCRLSFGGRYHNFSENLGKGDPETLRRTTKTY